ncbi:hypothetical protein ACA910_019090 [Epithemia clementina (nom. ined.)]
MGSDSGNIFLTWENLAFATPLLAVVGVYWFFKIFPLHVALGILLLIFIGYQIRNQMLAQRNEKLEKMDDKTIKALIAEEEEKELSQAKQQKQQKKALNKVQARLAKERKLEAKNNNDKKGGAANDEDDDDDEDEDLTAFVKKKK